MRNKKQKWMGWDGGRGDGWEGDWNEETGMGGKGGGIGEGWEGEGEEEKVGRGD